MYSFRELYESDLHRYGNAKLSSWHKKFYYYFRKLQTNTNPLLRYYYRFRFKKLQESHACFINYNVNTGRGLYIGHPYCIDVNPAAVLGDNVNLHKGVTIGRENRGLREGAPVIGNNVWIGVNATVVGHITVGDDVMITPNSFVNCDVPSHSIVIGNPCKIISKQDATKGYINNTVD